MRERERERETTKKITWTKMGKSELEREGERDERRARGVRKENRRRGVRRRLET